LALEHFSVPVFSFPDLHQYTKLFEVHLRRY